MNDCPRQNPAYQLTQMFFTLPHTFFQFWVRFLLLSKLFFKTSDYLLIGLNNEFQSHRSDCIVVGFPWWVNTVLCGKNVSCDFMFTSRSREDRFAGSTHQYGYRGGQHYR